MSAHRSLVSIRRRIADDDQAEYDRLWKQLEEAVTALGSHAWRFSAAADAARRVEFLEFSSGSDPRGEPAVAALLEQLERLAPGDIEDWVG